MGEWGLRRYEIIIIIIYIIKKKTGRLGQLSILVGNRPISYGCFFRCNLCVGKCGLLL